MPSPIPHTAPVQFSQARGWFEVTQLLDPSDTPIEVLDADLGFSLVGSVVLPGWLSGQGLVKLAADQIGGPLDKVIGKVTIPIPGSTSATDPTPKTYRWRVNVPANALPDADEMYQLGVIFAFLTTAGGHTDIGGFYDLGAYLVV